jgi:hypothetical protein
MQVANAYPHSREGQNVSFGDGHSAYEKLSDVGVKHDNIYTIQGGGNATPEDDIRRGQTMTGLTTDNNRQPARGTDSFLVNDDDRGINYPLN